jgi:hypothetical protein
VFNKCDRQSTPHLQSLHHVTIFFSNVFLITRNIFTRTLYFPWLSSKENLDKNRNSWNGPVKTKFAYLCTSGCCHLRNTLLVKKLYTSWDDGATAWNSLENCFPEYLAVALSRCVRNVGKFLSLQGIFNSGKIKKSQVLSQVTKVDGPFFVTDFLARNSRNLNSSRAGALSLWRIHCQARGQVFSSKQILVTLSAPLNNTVDSPFVPTLSTFASVLRVFGCPLLGS